MLTIQKHYLADLNQNFSIVHTISNDKEFQFEEHNHSHLCDLLLVTSGTLTQTINSQKVICKEGTLCFIRAKDVHSLYGVNVTFFNCNFYEETLQKLIEVAGGRGEVRLLLQQSDPILHQLSSEETLKVQSELLRLFHQQKNPASELHFNRLLLELFITYFLIQSSANHLSDPENKSNELATPGWLQELCRKMEQIEETKLNLDTLLTFANLSHPHVSRSFQKYLNLSPSQYISNLRLKRAALLLTNSNRTLFEIAIDTGFESQSYFYRKFKMFYGVTPAEYRDKWSQMAQLGKRNL